MERSSKCYPVIIADIQSHPNADRLALARVLGFTTVITTSSFAVGEQAWFIETDSVLTPELEQKILGGSKMHLSAGRVRAAKIRGVVSEGILVSRLLLTQKDVDEGVTKYEPPQRFQQGTHKDRQKYTREYTSELPRYIDTIRLEKVPDVFMEDDTVHVTSKLHGTSVRYGWSELQPQSWWAKVKLWFRRAFGYPTREFICGTRNVDIGTPALYHEVAERLGLADRVPPGMVLYGEIIGPGIQKHYDYGMKNPVLRLYAVQKDGKWLDYWEFRATARSLMLATVPLIAQGDWSIIKGKLKEFLDKAQYPTGEEMTGCPCREGLVIGTVVEHPDPRTGSRTIVKYINPEYLLNKDNSDEH